MILPLWMAFGLVAANIALATNSVPPATTATNSTADVEAAYQRLLAFDDATIREIQALAQQQQGPPDPKQPLRTDEEWQRLVRNKLDSLKKEYEEFLRQHPTHVRAMIAYGSFLTDIQEEEQALQWWLKAREADPTNPVVHNNLGNHYVHNGEIARAITAYETALALRPTEAVYHLNLANTLYLFRDDVRRLKNWDEAELFSRALEHFRKARDCEPDNYDYAYAYAETFYGVKNPDWERALDAWNYCLKLNLTPLQREQVFTHLARIHLRLGQPSRARECLAQVTSEPWQDLRRRLSEIALQQERGARPAGVPLPDTPKAP